MKNLIELPRILWSSGDERVEQDCACSTDISLFSMKAPPEQDTETDCACAPVAAPVQVGLPVGELWGISPSLYRVPLTDGYQLAFNPTGPVGAVVLNASAARMLDSFAIPTPLTSSATRQLAALGLLTPAHATEHAARNSPQTLTLWLHLTTRCNLRCTYCYAPRGNNDMSPEIGKAAVEGALRSAQAHGFRALKLKYAGGEPTLNLPTLRAVHKYARARAAQANLELREVVLTNGTTLTPPLLEWLRDEDIRIAISLDGLGAVHDRQRASTSGGSFTTVVQGIDRALALGVFPHLSITVSAHNVDHLAEGVAFALDRGLSFNLNFVRLAPGHSDLIPPPERLMAGLRAVLDELMRRLKAGVKPVFSFAGLLDRCDFGTPHRYPCAAGHAYLVVGPEGTLAPCHMEMERIVGTVWEVDPLAALQREGSFCNPPVEEKVECWECPWRYACAGGCPLMAQQYRATPAAPSLYCAVYREILPQLLRLEGLRILQSQSTA
ncbi:MAG: radical SAM protein [Anaerolineae bacterium]|nr:radical SAM protein [Anaerolineae bacterium]